MVAYVVKRLLYGVLTIFLVATATFVLMRLVPGGPFLGEKAITPAVQKALEAKYGLDKPVGQQYLTYMTDALRGDFGPSIKQRGRDVSDIISSKFPVSAKLGVMAVFFALLVGVPVGSLAAYYRGKFFDRLVSGYYEAEQVFAKLAPAAN